MLLSQFAAFSKACAPSVNRESEIQVTNGGFAEKPASKEIDKSDESMTEKSGEEDTLNGKRRVMNKAAAEWQQRIENGNRNMYLEKLNTAKHSKKIENQALEEKDKIQSKETNGEEDVVSNKSKIGQTRKGTATADASAEAFIIGDDTEDDDFGKGEAGGGHIDKPSWPAESKAKQLNEKPKESSAESVSEKYKSNKKLLEMHSVKKTLKEKSDFGKSGGQKAKEQNGQKSKWSVTGEDDWKEDAGSGDIGERKPALLEDYDGEAFLSDRIPRSNRRTLPELESLSLMPSLSAVPVPQLRTFYTALLLPSLMTLPSLRNNEYYQSLMFLKCLVEVAQLTFQEQSPNQKRKIMFV